MSQLDQLVNDMNNMADWYVTGPDEGQCTAVGCDRVRRSRGLCHMHYKRFHRNGTPKRVNENHGMYGTTEYTIWHGMKQRCLNPNNGQFKNYGGRGIKLCERWESFQNFYADMGNRPQAHELERINNNGNYEPGNCRWATKEEQCNNTRQNRILEYAGQSMTLTQWAKHLEINPITLRARIRRGWTVERALA